MKIETFETVRFVTLSAALNAVSENRFIRNQVAELLDDASHALTYVWGSNNRTLVSTRNFAESLENHYRGAQLPQAFYDFCETLRAIPNNVLLDLEN